MTVFDRYLFRNLAIATVLTGATLTAIVFLTQSLQFLELVMNSGASSAAFWLLTVLAIPRFFEIILPVALMAAVVFVYNRMTMDSELVVMRAIGAPPGKLAQPAMLLALIVAVILSITSLWVAPLTESDMDYTRDVIKSQYSTALFHEGIFNPVRPGLTVFIRDRKPNGELTGIMIYDSRKKDTSPIIVVAKRGEIVVRPEGQQVLVYDGSRQDINPKTNTLERLDFQRYTIDMPSQNGTVRDRWREPSERSFTELLHPNLADQRDVAGKRAFLIEAHRRIISPLLAPAYTVLALAFLLLGPLDRRGQSVRVILAISACVLIQGLYMAAFNLARINNFGLVLMYGFIFLPLVGGMAMLSEPADNLRQRLFFGARRRPAL
jgi:lipopolysaccharide export system permease protein